MQHLLVMCNLLNTKFITEGIDNNPSNTMSYAQQLNSIGVNYGNGILFMTTFKINF